HLFLTASPRNSATSPPSSAPGYLRSSVWMSSAPVRSPSQSWRISAAVSLRMTARSGSRRTWRPRPRSKRSRALGNSLGLPASISPVSTPASVIGDTPVLRPWSSGKRRRHGVQEGPEDLALGGDGPENALLRLARAGVLEHDGQGAGGVSGP